MEDGFNVEIGGGYSLNYAEIANHKELMAVTRLLAKQMMANPYIVVGDYIKELSDSDLKALMAAEDSHEYEDIILMSEMLATAEGCEQSPTDKVFQERTGQLITLLVIESLGRKGLVRVYHENMSFHEDMKDKVVVEKIGDDFA
jgi:hypothetical protein